MAKADKRGTGQLDPGGLDIRAAEGGSLIRLRVTPKASRNEVQGSAEGVLRLRIQAPPVDGAANEEARAFLAKLLGRPRSALSLERGPSSRDKVFRVEGLTPDQVRAALSASA